MFCDTHCHLFKEYYSDIDKVINDSIDLGVNKYIVAGCNNKDNEEVLELIKKDNIYGALGIHPESVLEYQREDLKFTENHIKDEKIVAIGEIGLDYHYGKDNREKQIELFEAQLQLAEKYDIPVVVHSRDATLDTINSLKKYKVIGVIHSFSGSLEVAKIYIRMGFLLGINGVVTFKNCNLKDTLKNIPLSSIVLETDSPYLTPVPFRGKTNYPGNVYYIAKFVSEVYDISMDKLVEITNSNVRGIFDI